jgi:DNA processing protein
LVCEKIITDFAGSDVLIVSGLAYGIDIIAHKSAIQNQLQTVGVLGHGLDMIYPAQHRKYATQMIENGGLITEFMQFTKPDRQNFPMRNRIVAGMADCVLVVETAERGGSLITADLGLDYNRDVLAIPGRVNDELSIGCNRLIQNSKAQLVMSAKDIQQIMGWEEKPEKKSAPQRQLFVELTEIEQKIVHYLNKKESQNIDVISNEIGLSMSVTSANLLGLEFKGVVKSMPGKMYCLV